MYYSYGVHDIMQYNSVLDCLDIVTKSSSDFVAHYLGKIIGA